MNVGYSVPGVVTGKPIALGGSQGRAEATGRGVVFALEEAAPKIGLEPAWRQPRSSRDSATSARWPRGLLQQVGVKVVAIGEVYGSIYNPNGIDIDRLIEYRPRTVGSTTFPTPSRSRIDDLLELPCDILVPAALENQIDAENAPKIKARIIVEGANGPTSPEADDILADRGIMSSPGHLCQCGRRDCLVLRMGPGVAGVSLDRAAGQ